jgi:hypothetical protein
MQKIRWHWSCYSGTVSVLPITQKIISLSHLLDTSSSVYDLSIKNWTAICRGRVTRTLTSTRKVRSRYDNRSTLKMDESSSETFVTTRNYRASQYRRPTSNNFDVERTSNFNFFSISSSVQTPEKQLTVGHGPFLLHNFQSVTHQTPYHSMLAYYQKIKHS